MHLSSPPVSPPEGVAQPDLPALLRVATRAAHDRLEDTLALTAPGLTRARYQAVLARFLGFWAEWEPSVAAALADDAFFAPRRRAGLLARDLAALGLGAEAIAALPRCAPPALPDRAAALGSLYVLEGSTLGGRVLVRHFAATLGLAADEPGCLYFSGHGAETGAMWAACRARLAAAPPEWSGGMVAAALDTFAVLTGWLAPVGAGMGDGA
jgi:heme oxygenase (biliverdin-IX-beta and delta-forming)